MDTYAVLKQISQLIDSKLDEKLQPVNQHLDTIEMKVELVNGKVDKAQQSVIQKIEMSQEDTIGALSDVINESYNLHEKRIKQIEEHLHIPQSQ